MKEESRSLIEGCEDLCSTSWDKDDYDGFVVKMNEYRRSINLLALNPLIAGYIPL